MKAFIACLGTETNSFSPIPTGWRNFEETMLFRGDATRHPPNLFSEPLHRWRARAEERQIEIVESIAAFAQPAGPTARPVWEALRDALLADLERALPVDLVLLSMHGSMIADGYDDCEGDLLTRVRALTGDAAAVGAELDLHCAVTDAMTGAADAIVTFKEYPHVDGGERADELFALLLDKARGRTRPHTALRGCRMINAWRTTEEPMAGFVREMKAAEREPGILSVSFAHGFPWADLPETPGQVLVITDDRPEAGAALAERLRERLWEIRDRSAAHYLDVDEALDRVSASAALPLVLADTADNAGGGAPGDSTFLLAAILERGLKSVVSGLYWDPVSVRFCKEAGEGATLDLRIGGKCGPTSGDPVDLRVTVRKIVENAEQSFGAGTAKMGDSVWVGADGIDLVLTEIRGQTFGPDAFTQFGIALEDKTAIVVKSSQHFHAGFAPIAGEVVYVAPPGAITPNFAEIPYRRIETPFWPRVADPFAEEAG